MTSMLNQAAVEELYSGTYLANYLKTMENLPDDLQRQVTTMRELDFQCRELLKEMETQQELYKSEKSDAVTRRRAVKSLQRCMIQSQELGDEKLRVTSLIIELIENRSRQLDQDLENLDPSKDHDKLEEVVYTKKVEVEKSDKGVAKRQRRQKQDNTKEDEVKEEPEKVVKKRRRRTKKEKEESMSVIDTIDPDEPLYCLCDQVSYGEMIGCDNDLCVVEWFHFNCVGLYTKPKGKWYCPNCRGDRPSVKRADLK